MENLPAELKVKILSKLSIYNKFKMRQLNKNWRSLVDAFFKIENLVIGSEKTIVHDFFGLDELISCFFLNEKLLYYSIVILEHSIFSNVKNLKITTTGSADLSSLLNQLSHLERLENLEIKNGFFKNVLIRSNLKYLNISWSSSQTNTIFDTPKLTNLKWEIANGISESVSFLHPKTVRLLDVEKFDSSILKFKNLEYLYCRKSTPKFSDFLSEFHKLKEVHYFVGKSEVRKQLLYKSLLKNKSLKIFYQFILFNSVNELDMYDNIDIHLGTLSLEAIDSLNDNLSRLAKRFSFLYLNYEDLDFYYKINKRKMPHEFLNKMDLHHLGIDKIDNIDNLKAILKNCKKIKILNIKSSLLEQNFYDKLPSLCSNLETLKIATEKQLDLKFLTGLKSLIRFIAPSQKTNIDFLSNIFGSIELKFCNCNIKNIGYTYLVYKNDTFYERSSISSRPFKNLDDFYKFLLKKDLLKLNDSLI